MTKIISSILATLILITSGIAQDTHLIDSLNQAYQTAEHDTVKINCLFALGEILIGTNPDTTLVIEEHALELAEKNLASESLTHPIKIKYLSFLSGALNNIGFIYMNQGKMQRALEFFHRSTKIVEELGDKKGMGSALNNIGLIYQNEGDIQKALAHFNKSLKICEEIEDKKGVAISLNNIGAIYKDQGDIPRALEYYHQSLKIKEEIGDKRGEATALNNIGYIYKDQGDIQQAIESYQRCLEIAKEIGNREWVAGSLSNIAGIYNNHGDPSCTSSKEECLRAGTQKALEHYRESLKIYEALDYKKGVAVALQNLGASLCELDSVDKGMEMLKKALRILMELNDKQWIGFTSDEISFWYLKINMNDSAEFYANLSMKLAQELEFPLSIQRAADNLSQVYRKQNKWQKSLEMYELFIQMRDSINNEATQKATIRQQTKYEFEKAQLVKEQEEKETARIAAEITSRRDNLQYSVVLICLLILGAGLLAMGRFSIPVRIAEGLIFFSFLIFFEFILVLADPYIEDWSGGAPGIKLLFNAGIAALIFPLHSLFESKLKRRLVKTT